MTSLVSKLAIVGATVAAVALAGCSAKEGSNVDVIAGKQLFVQKCGSCHVLNRAGTKGTTGPNLDDAFHRDVQEDFGEGAIRGVVRAQIKSPGRGGVMPSNLVTGQEAQNVAAYVAKVAAQPGKDEGLLALAVKPATSNKPAVAKDGVLTIPADPNGQLAYQFAKADAPAGEIEIDMPNTSGVLHDLAIEGKGETEKIAKGQSSFKADFTPGTYTYLCTIPGHAEAGMKGTLTVK